MDVIAPIVRGMSADSYRLYSNAARRNSTIWSRSCAAFSNSSSFAARFICDFEVLDHARDLVWRQRGQRQTRALGADAPSLLGAQPVGQVRTSCLMPVGVMPCSSL